MVISKGRKGNHGGVGRHPSPRVVRKEVQSKSRKDGMFLDPYRTYGTLRVTSWYPTGTKGPVDSIGVVLVDTGGVLIIINGRNREISREQTHD